MSQSQYKLTYYDLTGLGEPIRCLFRLAGVSFIDDRIPKNQKTHPNLLPEIKDALPWGTVPVLEMDGKKIGQSRAIARFLANRFNLAGSDDFEKAMCDELVDALCDFGNEWRDLDKIQDAEKKAEAFKNIQDVVIPFYMSKFSAILETNGKWLVGKSLTWTDLFFCQFCSLIMYHSKVQFVNDYPAIKKLMEDVNQVPPIQGWLKEDPNSEQKQLTK